MQVGGLALVHFDRLPAGPGKERIVQLTRQYQHKPAYFVDRLAGGVGQITAAFYPKDVIRGARACGRKVGICGQAPSDYPEFARFLVRCGIDSISLNPDTVLKTTQAIVEMEQQGTAPQDEVKTAAG